VAKAFSCDWAQSSVDKNQVYHVAFINLKKLSFKTYLKTYGSYVKQSNCKFFCYFNKLISYDFSCIIDVELFASCLSSYIFHLVPWVKETKDWKIPSPQRNGWYYTICFFLPSSFFFQMARGMLFRLLAFGVPGWQRCRSLSGKAFAGLVNHSAVSGMRDFQQLPQ